MKKIIGFIDYYLNEWHADNYPRMIAEKNSEFEVKYAYAAIEPPIEGRISNEEWAAQHGIELLSSIDELIEKSDVIIVFSPDNPEQHYALAEKALMSGKPVYIDKTFADTAAEAKRIFDFADKCGAPCFSTSALRFSDTFKTLKCEGVNHMTVTGTILPEIYIVHMIEQVAVVMGVDVDRTMYTGNDDSPSWLLHFRDGRTAFLNMVSYEPAFQLRVNYEDHNETIDVKDGYFQNMMNYLLDFFRTGEIPVEHDVTIKIMGIREACLAGRNKPMEWLDVK